MRRFFGEILAVRHDLQHLCIFDSVRCLFDTFVEDEFPSHDCLCSLHAHTIAKILVLSSSFMLSSISLLISSYLNLP
jgi:hypothetical protein